MGLVIRLRAADYEAMLAHVRRAAPLEACGLVAGQGVQSTAVFPVPNAAASPWRFRLEPSGHLRALQAMERAGWALLAVYHSHPQGGGALSAADLAGAREPVFYLLWWKTAARWQLRAFRIHNGRAYPVAWAVQPAAEAGARQR